MVPGFNHNIQRNGKVFHIQTEDSGVGNPHIITLLYLDGTIIGKKKTSYADIVAMDNLPVLVRQLMEEQHKSMLRELIRGAFDGSSPIQGVVEEVNTIPGKITASPPKPAAPAVKPPVAAPAAPLSTAAAKPAAQPTSGPTLQADDLGSLFGGGGEGEKSLDEIILSYLSDDNS